VDLWPILSLLGDQSAKGGKRGSVGQRPTTKRPTLPQRGATPRYSCNQDNAYAWLIWLRLRRAEKCAG